MQLQLDLLLNGQPIKASYRPPQFSSTQLAGGAVAVDRVYDQALGDGFLTIDGVLVSAVSSTNWAKTFRISNDVPVYRIPNGSGVTIVFQGAKRVIAAERNGEGLEELRALIAALAKLEQDV